MAVFTSETAAEMARKRWNAVKNGENNHRINTAYSGDDSGEDPLARELKEQMEETIDAYAACDDPKGNIYPVGVIYTLDCENVGLSRESALAYTMLTY